ncbi:hypothetical protein REPUB_Repub16aG0030600 [Reevesia pubescens]
MYPRDSGTSFTITDSNYGRDRRQLFHPYGTSKNFSLIWKSITHSLISLCLFSSILSFNIGYLVGDGSCINLWFDEWIEMVILNIKFPRIYDLDANNGGKIKEFGNRNNNLMSWKVNLIRYLFDWENDQWKDFLNTISEYTICLNMEDCLIWKWTSSGEYSPKSFCYYVLACIG